jgi:hypothetical protein
MGLDRKGQPGSSVRAGTKEAEVSEATTHTQGRGMIMCSDGYIARSSL